MQPQHQADQPSARLPEPRPAALAAWLQRAPPLMLMLLLTIWTVAHPWEGLWHDNVLYAAQALRQLHPEVFGRDLFFLYGSQDAYTFFTPLYAAAISALGLYGATLALLACGYGAWIAAATYLLNSFLSGKYFWLGLVILFSMPSDYGPMPLVFRLAESYLTPRLYAEALSMLALACLLRRKFPIAVIATLLACTLHPLMAAPCAGCLLCFWAVSYPQRIAAVVLAGTSATLVGAYLGVAPFDRLLQQMDDAWYQRVMEAAGLVTWSAWRAEEWLSRTVLAFSLVLTGMLLADGLLRRLFGSIALVGALGVLAAWLGSGLSHNVFIMQLQPWRALWLVQLAALMMLPFLTVWCWPRGGVFRLLLLAVFMACLTRNSIGGGLGLAAGAALWWLQRQSVAPRPSRAFLIMVAAALLSTTLLWWAELQYLMATSMAVMDTPQPAYLYQYLLGWTMLKSGGGWVLALALFVALVATEGHSGKAAQLAIFAILIFLVLLSAVVFDRREASHIYRDPAITEQISTRFLPLIAPTAIVYWDSDIQSSWFVLQRANYASYTQLTGLVFNRGTAIEGFRRLDRLRSLGVSDAVVGIDVRELQRKINQLPKPSLAALVHVCHDPVLDYVVLSTRYPEEVVEQVIDRRHGKNFYLYDCTRLRSRYVDTL
jgi:hypothetical protein